MQTAVLNPWRQTRSEHTNKWVLMRENRQTDFGREERHKERKDREVEQIREKMGCRKMEKWRVCCLLHDLAASDRIL